MKVSVIIPTYNEIDNIKKVLEIVEKVNVEKEIIVVDDLSNDGTREFIRRRKGIMTIYCIRRFRYYTGCRFRIFS